MPQRHGPRNPEQQQVELFEVPTGRPRWSDLPVDGRRAVTELLARMLRQQRQREAACQAQEVEHE